MMRSFGQMIDAVLLDCKLDEPTWGDQVRAHLNQAYVELMGQILVEQMVENFTLSISASTREYTLPVDFNGIIGLNLLTKSSASYGRDLTRSGLSQMEYMRQYQTGSSGASAEPGPFRVKKVEGVLARPTGTNAIKAYSSSAGDNGARVSCVGYSSATHQGHTHAEVSLTAAAVDEANAVSLGTGIYEPLQISKDSFTSGTITVFRADTPTVVIGTIPPWKVQSEFHVIEFADTPDASYTANLIYMRSPVGMMNRADVPIGFPERFVEAIEWGAKWRTRELRDDLTRTANAKARYDEMAGMLRMAHPKTKIDDAGISWDDGEAWNRDSIQLR